MSTIHSQENEKTEKTEDTSKFDDSYNEDDKLCFNSKLILDVNKYPPAKRESVDSVEIKYSVDMTNAPKKRLQEYLTSDLLDELENTNPVLTEEEKKNQTQDIQVTQVDNNVPIKNKFDQGLQGGEPIIPIPQIPMQKDSYHPYQKKKKPFEIREGDWTCFDCHNLNFAFRIKCNRCGLLKEISDKKCEEFRANVMRNMMNKNNVNYFNNNNNLYYNNMK